LVWSTTNSNGGKGEGVGVGKGEGGGDSASGEVVGEGARHPQTITIPARDRSAITLAFLIEAWSLALKAGGLKA